MDKATAIMYATLDCINRIFNDLIYGEAPKPVGAEKIIECMKDEYEVRSNREIYGALNRLLKLGLIKAKPRGRKQSIYLPTVKGIIEWLKTKQLIGLDWEEPGFLAEEEEEEKTREKTEEVESALMNEVWAAIEKVLPLVTENLSSIIETFSDRLPYPWLKDAYRKAFELIKAAEENRENPDEEEKFLTSIFPGPKESHTTGVRILIACARIAYIFAAVFSIQLRPQLLVGMLGSFTEFAVPGWE
jgi:DNA-binding PadR family transcriptional regulator